MMRIFFLSSLGLLIAANAYADCAPRPGKQTDAKIDKISLPVFDAKGRKYPGCILHSDGKVLGYAREDKLCRTAPGSRLKLRLSYGCCDTGPDSGDLECIIRSKPFLGIDPAHGNGVIVQGPIDK